MRLLTWNVAGFRAVMRKGFNEVIADINPDIVMLQETKMKLDQMCFKIDSAYLGYLNPAERAGYSGTALLTKHKPNSIVYGLPGDDEGRIITAEYDEFYVIGVYTPNAKEGLTRIEYRLEWDSMLRKWCSHLDKKKPVIVCGDMNVAFQEIDLKYPDKNQGRPGFSRQERGSLCELLCSGFVDAFRYLYPNKVQYSFWTNIGNARERNIGWRLDYFIVSERLLDCIKDVIYHNEALGSDHCPVSMDIDV